MAHHSVSHIQKTLTEPHKMPSMVLGADAVLVLQELTGCC